MGVRPARRHPIPGTLSIARPVPSDWSRRSYCDQPGGRLPWEEMMPTYEELREQQMAHLAKLRPIQAKRDRFISIDPLTGDSPEPLDYRAMQAAYDAMHEWEDEWLRLCKAVSD